MSTENKESIDKKTSLLMQDVMSDTLYLKRIMEQSAQEYFQQIEKKLPEEPNDEEDEYYKLSFGYKNSKDEFSRKFRPDDKISDLKNFAKVKFRRNSDFNMFTENEGKILFDTEAKLKDAGINKNDKIMIYDEEDL